MKTIHRNFPSTFPSMTYVSMQTGPEQMYRDTENFILD